MHRSALGDFESEKAEQFYIEVLRRMTPDQKSEAALQLWRMAVDTTRAGVALDHPDWTPEQVQREVARRIMELNGATRVIGSRPSSPGAS
jgi:hypothetical protein